MYKVAFSDLGGDSFGRLGNHLFEIACVYGTAKRTNRQVVLPSRWKYREHFNIPDSFFCDDIDLSQYTTFRYDGNFYVDFPDGNIDLQGWFQSYRYFHDYRTDIINMFFPLSRRNYNDYCGIHIRRTDYLAFGWDIFDRNYYLNIINKNKETKVIVFSDDIPWCKNEFGDNFEYSTNSDIDDLFTMACCKRIIATNSSFSWWGAYLSNHKNCHFPDLWVHRIPYTELELIIPEWKNEY